jgi:hypothetical protein
LKISDFLHTGAENAQTARELCDLLHLDKRELTAAIERERRQGSPICASCNSGNAGYFLAGNKQEMQNYCESLQHRAAEIHATRQACLNTIDDLPEAEGRA